MIILYLFCEDFMNFIGSSVFFSSDLFCIDISFISTAFVFCISCPAF